MMQQQDVELHTRSFGTGRAVVVMHGLLGSGRNWQAIGKALANDNEIILVDLRNHGSSPWSDSMTYSSMAADILRLLDDRGLEQAVLVGHSMGGKVAMATALAAPDRVAGLAVVDIAPVAYDHAHGFRDYLSNMLSLDLASMSRRSDVEAGLAQTIAEAPIRAFLAQNSMTAEKGLSWQANLLVLRDSLPAITGWEEPPDGTVFDGPALFLRGGHSPYVAEEHMTRIHTLFADAVIETIAGAGHWVHAEAPAKTVAALRGLIERAAGAD